MMVPGILLATGAGSALLLMLRSGALDSTYFGASLAALLLVSALKAPYYAKGAGIGLPRALAGAVIAGALSLAMVVAIALGIKDPKYIAFAVPGLLIVTVAASMAYGRVLPDSPWDLLTPARLGLLQLAGAAMTTVWIAFAAGIEPSISPRNFELFRGILQGIAMILCSALAGVWDGAVLCTFCAKDRMAGAVAASVRANLVLLLAGLAFIAWWAVR